MGHTYATGAGTAMVFLRLAIGGWFYGSLRNTQATASAAVRGFCKVFGLLAMVWFMAQPLTVFISRIFAPYLRHMIVHCGTQGVQAMALSGTSHLFLKRKSDFWSISGVGTI